MLVLFDSCGTPLFDNVKRGFPRRIRTVPSARAALVLASIFRPWSWATQSKDPGCADQLPLQWVCGPRLFSVQLCSDQSRNPVLSSVMW